MNESIHSNTDDVYIYIYNYACVYINWTRTNSKEARRNWRNPLQNNKAYTKEVKIFPDTHTSTLMLGIKCQGRNENPRNSIENANHNCTAALELYGGLKYIFLSLSFSLRYCVMKIHMSPNVWLVSWFKWKSVFELNIVYEGILHVWYHGINSTLYTTAHCLVKCLFKNFKRAHSWQILHYIIIIYWIINLV